LPIYVSKLTINCSITFCAKTIIYFVRWLHLGVNNTLSVVAVITCSFQSALPPSKTITFQLECYLKIHVLVIVSQVQQCDFYICLVYYKTHFVLHFLPLFLCL
jgi:hypothetical protein